MTTYPLEFHRRSEQKWVLRAQAARESPRAPHWSVIVGRTNPNVVTSWPEGHGCGNSGNGLRAEYNAADQPVPERLAALLKEL